MQHKPILKKGCMK